MFDRAIKHRMLALVVACVWVWSGPATAATGPLRDEIVCEPPAGWPDHACPVGTPEGEWEQDLTCGVIPGGDLFNAGCNSPAIPPPFSPISCGQTICGTWSIVVQGTTVLRDIDWYEVEFTQRTLMIVDVTAEFDVHLGLITSCGTGDCDMMPEFPDYWTAGGVYSAACNDPEQSPGGYEARNHHFERCVEPGKWWIFVSGDWRQGPVDCADYVLTLQCQAPCHVPCCVGSDVCVEVSETECRYTDDQCPGALGGGVLDATDSAPGLCAWGCTGAVVLDCDSSQEVDNSVNSDTAMPPMSCATGDSIGVLWFQFVATDTSVTISTCGTIVGDDSVFALYGGDCVNYLDELACSEDEDCGPDDWLGRICHCYPPLVVGETYYIQFASWGEASQGVYLLEIDCPGYCDGGACCLPDGSCVCTCGSAECEAAGGSYLGSGTWCAPGICDEPPLGACCLEDGSCTLVTETMCDAIGVEWIAGAECVPNLCGGACCSVAFGHYQCSDSAAAACVAPNKTYYPGEDCSDPLFDCLEAACQPQAARSCRLHGAAGELCLDLGVSAGVEPRLGGITKLEVDLGGRVYDTNPVTVDCSLPWSGTATASDPSAGANNTVTVTFAPALPDEACCVVSLACGAEVCVRGLAGDIDRSGLVTPGDASIIKPHFTETPTAATCMYDFDVSGLITPGDFSQVKPRFGHTAPACP